MRLLVVDAHSKWPEIVRMSRTMAELNTKSLKSMFARFELPEQLVTDNGPQWVSDLKLFVRITTLDIFVQPRIALQVKRTS